MHTGYIFLKVEETIMYHASVYLFLCVATLFSFSHCNPFTVHNDPLSPLAESVYAKKTTRQLRAAQLETQIGKRSVEQALRCDHELHYVDGKLH